MATGPQRTPRTRGARDMTVGPCQPPHCARAWDDELAATATTNTTNDGVENAEAADQPAAKPTPRARRPRKRLLKDPVAAASSGTSGPLPHYSSDGTNPRQHDAVGNVAKLLMSISTKEAGGGASSGPSITRRRTRRKSSGCCMYHNRDIKYDRTRLITTSFDLSTARLFYPPLYTSHCIVLDRNFRLWTRRVGNLTPRVGHKYLDFTSLSQQGLQSPPS